MQVIHHVDAQSRHGAGRAFGGVVPPALARVLPPGQREVSLHLMDHPHLTVVDHLAEAAVTPLLAAIMADLEGDARLLCRLVGLAPVGGGQRERFLDKHVFSCGSRLANDIHVGRVWGGQQDPFHLEIAQQFVQTCRLAATDLFCERLAPFLASRETAHYLGRSAAVHRTRQHSPPPTKTYRRQTHLIFSHGFSFF